MIIKLQKDDWKHFRQGSKFSTEHFNHFADGALLYSQLTVGFFSTGYFKSLVCSLKEYEVCLSQYTFNHLIFNQHLCSYFFKTYFKTILFETAMNSHLTNETGVCL